MTPRWKPSQPQRKFKARAYRENPKAKFQDMTPTQVQTLTGNRSCQGWFDEEEFRDWFLNQDYTRQLLEAGSEVAVQRLLEILDETEVGPREAVTSGTQVAAAKLILEMANYAPAKRKEVVFKDKDIDGMDKDQLQDYVNDNIHLLKKEEVSE